MRTRVIKMAEYHFRHRRCQPRNSVVTGEIPVCSARRLRRWRREYRSLQPFARHLFIIISGRSRRLSRSVLTARIPKTPTDLSVARGTTKARMTDLQRTLETEKPSDVWRCLCTSYFECSVALLGTLRTRNSAGLSSLSTTTITIIAHYHPDLPAPQRYCYRGRRLLKSRMASNEHRQDDSCHSWKGR